MAARKVPGVYVLPTIDAVLSDMIHNSASSNLVLGEKTCKTGSVNPISESNLEGSS